MWDAGFQGKGELLERALPLCSQTPGDHTKGWLQAYNGGVVSHCARAAGKQTEPPVSVPVRLGPIAPNPLPGFHPIRLGALSAPHPAPQVNPLLPIAYLAASNGASLPGFGCHQLPWPNNTPSRSRVQICKMSVTGLPGENHWQGAITGHTLPLDFHVRECSAQGSQLKRSQPNGKVGIVQG